MASHLTLEFIGNKEAMFDLMTTRYPGPVAAKQIQIITPPPAWLAAGLRCLCWHAGMFDL